VSYTCVIVAFGRIANGTGKLEGTCRNEDRKGCRMEKNLFSQDFQPDFPVFTTDVRGHGIGQDSEEHAASFPLHILIPLTFS
jgi:hypothetical protein